jgi:hypothetical protein
MVQGLPWKHETLSSNSRTTKKKKKVQVTQQEKLVKIGKTSEGRQGAISEMGGGKERTID